MIYSTVFHTVLVLRDFIVITELLSFQTCLILKSSLLLLIHSRPFLLLRLPYFIATVSLVHFLSLFSWVRRRQISTWVTCYLSFIIINFRRIQHAMRLVLKNNFYAESIKHGVKAVTPSVNHTICIGIVEETGYRMGWFSRHKFCISGLKVHR